MGHVLQNEIFGSIGNLVGNTAWLCFRVTKYHCLIVLLVSGTCRASNQYPGNLLAGAIHYLVKAESESAS